MEKEEAARVAAAMTPLVNAYLLALAVAQVERKRMDRLDTELLGEFKLHNQYTGQLITKPNEAWMVDMKEAEPYHAERNRSIRAMGYRSVPDGYCPALVAENRVIKCETAMLQEIGRVAQSLVAFAGGHVYGALRKNAIDLIVKLVVYAPGYEPPPELVKWRNERAA